MKLLQLNCWAGKLATQIARLIEKEQPDIICLQEACDLQERKGSIIDPYRKFAPIQDYPHEAFAPIMTMRYMHEVFGVGNAVVSKYDIASQHSFFTAGKLIEDIETVGIKSDVGRNLLHSQIATPQGKIHVLTHHGSHSPTGKDGAPANTQQMQLIADYIAKLDGPVILTGDFNLHPQSDSLQPIHDLLVNLPLKYKIDNTRTELAKRSEVIDYIYISDYINDTACYASDALVSDHKALILEFAV